MIEAMETRPDGAETLRVRPLAMRPTSDRQGRRSEVEARSCGLTDIGRKRRRNEDCFGLDDRQRIYMVADGVAGGNRGDLAACLAVETVLESVASGARLEHAVHRAHRQILEEIRQDPSLHSMGTTVVGLQVEGRDSAMIAHVGDSRAYRLRGGELELLTRDHTLASELHSMGRSSLGGAADHPMRHVLTRALGAHQELDVETTAVSLRAGDLFLLCSDGLTKMVDDQDVQTCLEAGGGIEETCRRLVRRALQRGGSDNVTVVLVKVLEAQDLRN